MNITNLKRKIIAVDVDGTLTYDTAWTEEDCLKCKPKKETIEIVNYLAQWNMIIIYTARRDELILPTIQWLRKNGITFHCIAERKPPADLFIDNTAFKIKDLTKQE